MIREKNSDSREELIALVCMTFQRQAQFVTRIFFTLQFS